MTMPPKPTKAELAAAVHKTVPDLLAPGLSVLFCGINPGLYTAAIGHHFGRPGNRFWPALHGAGFTPRLFKPWEEHELLGLGYGITNMVARTTNAASELSPDEYIAGGKRLTRIMQQYQPRVVAFLGIGAYRSAFGRPKAQLDERKPLNLCTCADKRMELQSRSRVSKEGRKQYAGITILFVSFIILSGNPLTG